MLDARRWTGFAAAVGLLVVACGPGTVSSGSTAASVASTGSLSDSTSLATPTSSTASTTVDASSTSGSEASATGVESSSMGPSPDLGEPLPCDTYAQDCPPGQKCTLEDPFGDVEQGFGHICVPVVDDPAKIDEPCTVTGELGSGLDDCDEGLICWDYDAVGHGTCWIFCSGIPGEGKCPEGMQCQPTAEAYLDVCLRPCNPLLLDCPAPNDVCIPPGGFEPGIGEPFFCWDQDQNGALHSTCHSAAECGKGLVCLGSSPAIECTSDACCQPVCDTQAPNECPGEGQECVAWYPPEPAPPGEENVGVCTLPP